MPAGIKYQPLVGRISVADELLNTLIEFVVNSMRGFSIIIDSFKGYPVLYSTVYDVLF